MRDNINLILVTLQKQLTQFGMISEEIYATWFVLA